MCGTTKGKCEWCGKSFTGNKGKRFCTRACKAKQKRADGSWGGAPKPCQQCGETFQPSKKEQEFCSPGCVSLSQRKHQGNYECEKCGKEFWRKLTGKYYQDDLEPKYCSRECSIQANRKFPVKLPVITKICACGVDAVVGYKCLVCWIEGKNQAAERAREYKREHYQPVPKWKQQCKECGSDFMRNRVSKYCTERCETRVSNRNRRARKKKAFVESVKLVDLIKRDKGICQLCGEKVLLNLPTTRPPHQMSPTIDHVIPLAKDGKHSMKNCQLAHFRCNSIKSDNLMPKMALRDMA